MKWLELSADKFEPIPDIQFSLKKPLFAASVVLKYWLADAGPGTAGARKPRARAELRAKIPLKSEMHYIIDVVGMAGGSANDVRFAFEKILEQDESNGRGRMIESLGNAIVIGKTDLTEDRIEVINESRAQLLAHLLTLPAFIQSRDSAESVYGGYIVLGHRIEALRFDRVSAAAMNQTDNGAGSHETYEVRTLRVPKMLAEKEWSALAWKSRTPFKFDYDVSRKTLTSASFRVPVIGNITIHA